MSKSNTSPATPQPSDAKLILPLGRGARGKTFVTRWLVERAQMLGRDVVVADVDRTNATLSNYFSNVVSPPSADDRDVREFMADFLERQIAEKFNSVVDLGGGDLTLKEMARESQLVQFLTAYGIMPVAIHLIGPDADDLAYLQEVERDAVFAPAATILVMNEAMVPTHRTPFSAFESTVRHHPIFTKAVERGAVPVRMPRLEPASEIDAARLAFAAAEDGAGDRDGRPVIGPWRRQQIAIWRREMEESFAPVAGWLP